MMDCHDAKERILEGRESAAVRRHLGRCEDCGAYSEELAGGGRELAEAFLAHSPSPGFEERIAARLSEREISIRERRPARVLVPLIATAAVLLGYLALFPGREQVPRGPDPLPIAVTEPFRENPLSVILHRSGSTGPTRLILEFAGDSRSLDLTGDVEGAMLNAWALGARRVEMVIAPEVPGHEIVSAIEILEKAGFEFQLTRLKEPVPVRIPPGD